MAERLSTSDKLDIILQDLAVIKVAVKKVDEHEETLNGNGKAGLKTEVELLKQFQKGAVTAAIILGGALVTETGALAYAMLTHQFKFP